MRKLVLFMALLGVFSMLFSAACAGADGASGAPGAPGLPGSPGEPGASGSPGEPGSPGAAGEPGNPGEPGAAGATGAAGSKGATGATGPTGTTGSMGSTGADGLDWPGAIPAAYTAADGVLGGVAYAKWWVTEANGSGTQPTTTVAADFYRCKSCHGWDGLGSEGAYADRTGQSTGKATRPDVTAVNLRASALRESPTELFNLIARPSGRTIDAADNTHPAFADLLTDAQIWNLVKFMREEWIEPTDLYTMKVEGPKMHWDYAIAPAVLVTPSRTYTNIGIGGDAARGDSLYTSTCAGCHSADGIAFGKSVGGLIRSKPHEIWLKIVFGEPGTGMTPGSTLTDLQDLKDLFKALADDPVKYPD